MYLMTPHVLTTWEKSENEKEQYKNWLKNKKMPNKYQ
jgi:hypothetical protein